TIWSTYLAARSFPLLGTIKTDLKTYIKLFKYGIPVTLATIFSTLVSSLDTVVLTYFRSLEEVAIYNVAVPTVNLLRYFPKAITVLLFPMSTEMFYSHKSKLNSAIGKLYSQLLLFGVPMTLAMFLFSEELILFLFGDRFVSAAEAMMILSVGMLFGIYYMINQTIFLGINEPKTYAKLIFFELLFSGTLDVLLIPKFGVAGAAFSTAISLFLMAIISIFTLKKKVSLSLPLVPLFKIAMLNILVFGPLILLILTFSGAVIKLAFGLSFGAIYLFTAYKMKMFNPIED
ncbi:MAG: oligosaccharide flippase family protein, partial [Nanoarchaeota archaeon]|nr:oligosaccharide flippase family protein [Nanoarchaeota archaeon]